MKSRQLTIAGTTTLACLCILSLAEAKKPGGGGKPADYSIVDLHPGAGYFESEARGLNDRGEAVGIAKNSDGVFAVHWKLVNGFPVHAFLDEGDAIPGSTGTFAINRHSGIAGFGDFVVDEGGKPVLRSRGLFWSRPEAAPIVLPPPAGFNSCWPLGMNDDGIVVGVAHFWGKCVAADGTEHVRSLAQTGVAWRVQIDENGPFVSATLDLGGVDSDDSSNATGVNNAAGGVAMVVGTSADPTYDGDCPAGAVATAVNWALLLDDDGGLSKIGPVSLGASCGGPESWGDAVNNAGDACGLSTTADNTRCGFVLVDGALQQLSATKRSYFDNVAVRDLNDAATPQVVGHLNDVRTSAWFAVVWTNGTPTSLDSLVGDSPFDELADAKTISAHGNIVGVGYVDGASHAFLMLKN